jgi:dienelactone hydrolase
MLCALGCGLAGTAQAQAAISVEKVSFKVEQAFEPGAAVTGELRIPDSGPARLPAVLILHGSAGVDGRGAFYAEALNRAGIATLEIDMFQGRGRPRYTRDNMPHAYQSLGLLARHPRIDPARVGVMGFSWGGAMSLFLSSQEVARKYSRGGARFAAHLGLYPVCWTHRTVLAGTNPAYPPSTYGEVTGPVHILAGEKDDYDDPDSCARFIEELPAETRRRFSLTLYPGGTHGWDGRAGGAFYDAAANKGKGGNVDVIADADIARRSREFAVDFFRKHLAVR